MCFVIDKTTRTVSENGLNNTVLNVRSDCECRPKFSVQVGHAIRLVHRRFYELFPLYASKADGRERDVRVVDVE